MVILIYRSHYFMQNKYMLLSQEKEACFVPVGSSSYLMYSNHKCILWVIFSSRFASFGPIRFAIHCSSLLVHQTSRRKEYLRARSCEYCMPKPQLG